MFKDKMTMLILSCDKFSDLWDGHVELLDKNWPDRDMDTYIVTDCNTEKTYKNVKIISAGKEKEWSERLKFALKYVNTEYVFITLDDYFLTQKVINRKIKCLIELMQEKNIDYMRLFLRPKCPKSAEMRDYKNIYWINTNDRYSVNLYAGIWKKRFLENTVRKPKNAWQFEVALPKIATEVGAKCAMSNNKEFVILDVVRKGKLLHKATRYFKKHGVYYGNRPVISRWYEIKLGIRTWGVRLMPKCVTDFVRSIMIKLGHHYYSQEIDR